jgi:hypothetical protein
LADVFLVLSEENSAAARRVINHMVRQGYAPEFQMGGYPSAMWRVSFAGNRKLKSGDFFWMGFSIEYLNRFFVTLHCINPLHLLPVVHEQGNNALEWFSDNWHQVCNGCGYCKSKFKEPGPYVIEVRGHKRRLCHQNWITERNPKPKQIGNILGMVDVHTLAGMVPKAG